MTSTGPAELRLNTAVVRAGMAAHNIKSLDALADKVGLSRATVVRVMGGHLAPSPAFIAGIHLRLVIEAVEPARPRATT
jgi:hypothetical protein